MSIIKPILFNTSMVKAILDGIKTQTRRTNGLEKFNENPNIFRYDGTSSFDDQPQFYEHYFEVLNDHGEPTEEYIQVMSKVKPGDILWVRETFAELINGHNEVYRAYKADGVQKNTDGIGDFKWKPSIYMPKAVCRIFLKVTNVRVERLQDITEEDAIAEGVKKHSDYGSTGYIHYGEPDSAYTDIDAVWSFETLWKSINGEENWKENPWVWVYEFERIQKSGNFFKSN